MLPRFKNFISSFLGSQEELGFRADAGETVMFARELEQVRAKIYEVPYLEFKGRQFVPPSSDKMDPGAEVLTYTWYDRVANAEIVRDWGGNPPRADVFGGQVTHNVKHFWLAYAWNVQELRAAAFAGKPLSSLKANACMQGMQQFIDQSLTVGIAGLNIKGLFNLASTNTYTPPASAVSGSTTWALKTPREILTDMHAVGRKVYVDSKEIEVIDSMILPTDQYGIISTRTMGDGDNRTILQCFMDTQRDLKYKINSVETSPLLASSSDWTGARGVGYRKSPDVLASIIPLEPTQGAPQWTGLEAQTIMEARTGGVQCYRPKAVCYFDGI